MVILPLHQSRTIKFNWVINHFVVSCDILGCDARSLVSGYQRFGATHRLYLKKTRRHNPEDHNRHMRFEVLTLKMSTLFFCVGITTQKNNIVDIFTAVKAWNLILYNISSLLYNAVGFQDNSVAFVVVFCYWICRNKMLYLLKHSVTVVPITHTTHTVSFRLM
jgi:hypothetical protein